MQPIVLIGYIISEIDRKPLNQIENVLSGVWDIEKIQSSVENQYHILS